MSMNKHASYEKSYHSWPRSLRPVGPARVRPGPTATGPGPARPEAPGYAWAATMTRGTAHARPDDPVLNGLIKKINLLILKK
jgi:hypothetical protein